VGVLDRLDNYFYSRKASEIWMMVILFSILIGYLVYVLFSDISSKYRQEQTQKNIKLQREINNAKSYLKSITINGDRNFYIKDLDRKIVNAKRDLNDLRNKLSKIDSAKHQLKDILYNKQNWSKFLHSIALKSEQNNLHLYSLSNTPVEQNKTFGKILNIHIKAQGQYNDIISFMNDLEETKLVTTIGTIGLRATKTEPIVDINMSVWGIKE